MATGLLVMSLPYNDFLDLDDNDAGSKLPDEYSEFFPVLTVELVGSLFIYLAFLFIHSPESKSCFIIPNLDAQLTNYQWNSQKPSKHFTMGFACAFSRLQATSCPEEPSICHL